jgi:transposase
VLGEAATAAAKTDTFLGERYRRLVKGMPKKRALAAIEHSILVIIFHLFADPNACFVDLGSDFYERCLDTERRARHGVRQPMALAHTFTLSPAA